MILKRGDIIEARCHLHDFDQCACAPGPWRVKRVVNGRAECIHLTRQFNDGTAPGLGVHESMTRLASKDVIQDALEESHVRTP